LPEGCWCVPLTAALNKLSMLNTTARAGIQYINGVEECGRSTLNF
jgi:hypothetical protein